MRISVHALIATALVLGLVSVSDGAENYVLNSKEIVKSADWSKMETIRVELDEFSFSPSEIVFAKDVPYKIEIANKGTVKHYFVADKFFRSIATRKVQSNADGEIKAPYFSALEVFPGRSLDLYFVPVEIGEYFLECTIEGHADQGMTGKIIIQ